MKWIFLFTTIVTLLTACSAPANQQTAAPASTDSLPAKMPNPASAYCVEQGYTSEIRTAADGSQSGVCIFPNGSECDEWAYFRGECELASQATEPILAPTQIYAPSRGIVIPQSVVTPAGAIIDPRNDMLDLTGGLIFYDRNGLTLGELRAPRTSAVHAAGHYQGSLDLPLIFHSFELESQQHNLSVNSGGTPADPGGQVSLLAPLGDKDMLSGLVGVPGEPILFYIVFQPLDVTLQSRFMLGSQDSIAAAAPVLTLESNDSRYWKPVAIQLKAGTPNGIWFTRIPWGIGGEIVFTPNEGLSYYSLVEGTVTEILPPEAQFNSLSNDQTRVAYSQRMETGSEFFIQDLIGGDPILIPTLPESDRGAGDAVFSPSDQYIAWREAGGSYFDGNFQQKIRIATLEGQIVGDFSDVAFYKAAELNEGGTEARPVGWLDEESILVQVIAPEKPHDSTLIKLNVRTGEFTLFARGFFAGWFYP